MSSAAPGDPLECLARKCAQAQRQLDTQVKQTGAVDSTIMAELTAFAWQLSDFLAAGLSPALLDSMAGSDAQCIKNICNGLVADLKSLAGRHSPQPTDSAWVNAYEHALELILTELLPMAHRLLSAEALQILQDELKIFSTLDIDQDNSN